MLHSKCSRVVCVFLGALNKFLMERVKRLGSNESDLDGEHYD